MKRVTTYAIEMLLAGFMFHGGCSKSFLEITPNGVLDEAVLATYEGVDGLLIGAYSMLDGVASGIGGWGSATSGWIFGSMRGLEANLGSDAGDSSYGHAFKRYRERPDNLYLNEKWMAVYEGIARCNQTIKVAGIAFDSGNITMDEYESFLSQARALRGFYHFEAWRLWADRTSNLYVPFIDEHTNLSKITNTEDIRNRIIEDLTEGTKLPLDMGQAGRFNRSVSQVLLAKALMQMYGDYTTALTLLTEVSVSGTNPAGQKAELEASYGDIFNLENRNGVENIYTVQYSVNDGSGGWNGGWAEILNFPYSSEGPGGCCGFFQPTQDFVNSFRTDSSGLPFIHTYNDEKVANDQGILSSDPFPEYEGNLDPRLDWSVGRRGIPYWDWGEHPGMDWIREQSFAGPYSPKKQVYKRSQEDIYTEVGHWHRGFTANGYRMIRYADVLLLKAECKAMTGSGDLGLGEVNAVRNRAANPEGFVKEEDRITDAAHYLIEPYPDFPDAAFAMQTIKFERKLELGQEGHRYYDLQRWGKVESELNRILDYERSMEWGHVHYGDATVGPEDVNFPLPQRQIDLHHGRLLQNR